MKRNTLTTAVLAGLTGIAGMASVSHAVNVNPDGLGQVLLYPYYTAREGNQTLVSIVNTTNRAKAVKIRFIEALNSREVLDFNIYMSPYDVWVASVNTQDGIPGITIPDTTCTVPYLQGGELDDDGVPVPAFQEFLDYEYTGDNDDGGPQGIERSASGYIEVIEMGSLLETPEAFVPTSPTAIAWAAKHDETGVPNACGALVAAWTEGGTPDLAEGDFTSQWVGNEDYGFATAAAETEPVAGGLFGSASIVNATNGIQIPYNATAIDGFFDYDTTTLHERPGNTAPSLSSGNRNTSFAFNNGEPEDQTWLDPDSGDDFPLLALNAVITQNMIMNEYLIDDVMGAKTEWVITMPTKRFHVDASPTGGRAEDDPIPPFTTTWNYDGEDDFEPACETFTFAQPNTLDGWLSETGSRFWDREEQPGPDDPTLAPPIVSPEPPGEDVDPFDFDLCREANVIRIAGDSAPSVSEIFGEPLRSDDFLPLSFTNVQLETSSGWMRIDLENIDATTVRESVVADTGREVVRGLPVIGFAATSILNENAQDGVLANYGAAYNHRGSRSFTASAD